MYRFEDRRPRPEMRRAETDRRQDAERASAPRAAATPHVWVQPAFGAHILGQLAPEQASAAAVARAYAQPEARTSPRPRSDRRV